MHAEGYLEDERNRNGHELSVRRQRGHSAIERFLNSVVLGVRRIDVEVH